VSNGKFQFGQKIPLWLQNKKSSVFTFFGELSSARKFWETFITPIEAGGPLGAGKDLLWEEQVLGAGEEHVREAPPARIYFSFL
jgi:hypothetical protein